MRHIFSYLRRAGLLAGTLVLLNSGAFAQTTDTTTDPLLTDPVVTDPVETDPMLIEPEWQPGDGRPVWSRSPNPTSAPDSSWRPGDGRPPWARANGTLTLDDSGTTLVFGRPPWAGPRGDPFALRGERTGDAQALRPARGGLARGIGGRGRGRR